MQTPWTLQELRVTGPWGTAVANATSLKCGPVPQYNRLNLVLFDCPISHLAMRRQNVTVALTVNGASHTLFVGVVAAARRIVGGSEENVVYCEVDGAESLVDRDYCNSVRDAEPGGFNAYFNENGLPNCSTTAATFGSGRYWTARLAIEKIRDGFLRDPAVLGITDVALAAMPASADSQLRPLDIRGVRPLQAIAEILAQAGLRMAYRYASGSAVPAIFGQSGNGAFGVVYRPDQVASLAGRAHDNEVYEINVGYDTRQTTDRMDAISGRRLHETEYSTDGASPLLAGQASSDAGFAWEYTVNVNAYNAAGLGPNLAVGTPPLPLRETLVTRRELIGTYLSAAVVTADPESGYEVDVRETICVEDAGVWWRVAGGARFYPDAEGGVVLRLAKIVTIVVDDDGQTENITVSDLVAPGVRFTAATLVRGTQYYSTYAYSPDVANAVDGLVNAEQLQATSRRNSRLPTSSATTSTWPVVEPSATAVYRDVTADLQELLVGPYEANGVDAVVAEVFLPFWPAEVPVGALLSITNEPMNTGLLGTEIITEVNWSLNDVEVRFTATNAFDLYGRLSIADTRRMINTIRKARRQSTRVRT